MNRLTPVLMVEDVKESIEFYHSIFEFKTTIIVPSEEMPVFAAMEKNGIEIMFQERTSMEEEYELFKGKDIGGTFTLYLDLGEVKSLYDICKEKKVKFVKDLHKTFYGADEFAILDNNNYTLVITKR